MVKRPKMCDKCKTYEAFYSMEYDDPMAEKRIKVKLCRTCMLMMRNTIKKCQGME